MARDDYDDRPYRGTGELSGLDKFLNNTVVAVILALLSAFCCPLLGLILGGIGAATCKNPDSKRNAIIVLVGGVVGLLLGIASFATNNFGMGGGFGVPKQ